MDKYNDTPVKVMLYPAMLFMILGMLFGLYIAINGFLLPDYFSGEYVHFGKVRPMHVGHVLLLWLLSADLGLAYYYVPRLCGITLWSPRLAYIAATFWWSSLVIGIFSFPWGTNFGWEYAELPTWIGWLPIKAMFYIGFILFSINIRKQLLQRATGFTENDIVFFCNKCFPDRCSTKTGVYKLFQIYRNFIRCFFIYS